MGSYRHDTQQQKVSEFDESPLPATYHKDHATDQTLQTTD